MPRHRALLASLLLAFALAVSGCSTGGSDADPAGEEAAAPPPATAPGPTDEPVAEPVDDSDQLFTKAELPKLALQPADLTAQMKKVQAESGTLTLEQAGILLDDQVAEMEELGLNGIHEVVYDSRRQDLRLASRVWLFEGDEGAEKWLSRTQEDLQTFGLELIEAPSLGHGSWAGRGNLNESDVITHGFRLDNAVIVVSQSSQSLQLSEDDALLAAQKALERARSV